MTEPATPPGIRVRLLGSADLSGPAASDVAAVLARPKLLALLAFLAAATPRGFHRRDTLLGLLWAEMDQERARGALRQSLYRLRQRLGDGVIATRGDEEVALSDDRVKCDVVLFEEALARGAIEEALDLYRGDLLEGFHVTGAPLFEQWLAERREELRRRAQHAAWELAQRARDAANVPAAAYRGRQALRLAPYDEAAARQTIELLDRMGDRAGALREYEAFAQRLRDDLEVEPSPETRALADRIRARTSPGPATPDTARTPKTDTVAASAQLVPDSRARRWLSLSRSRLGVLAGAVVLLAIAVAWAVVSAGWRARGDEARVVVAVFENLTGESDLDPLGRMAADWITQGLDQVPVVEVVPSTNGVVARPDIGAGASGGRPDIRALARATAAGTVVEGAYYLAGDSISFQAQIVDGRSGRLRRAVPPVIGPRMAPGVLIDTLRQAVAAAVATLFDSRVHIVLGDRTPSFEAYRAYLEGYRAFSQVPTNSDDAIRLLSRAVALDSAFLDPRFLLVSASLNAGDYVGADSSAQFLARNRHRMTPSQGRLLDYLMAFTRGDRTAALAAVRAEGGSSLGVEALRANHLHEAIEALRSAGNLSGSYDQWRTLMDAYHMLGEYQLELREARRAREAHPEQTAILEAELRARAALGQIDEVRRGLQEGLGLPTEGSPAATGLKLHLATELRAHGHRQASFEVADSVIAWYRAHPPARAATPGGPVTVGDRWILARAYYLRERWDDAEALIRELASENPDEIRYLGYLGTLAARKGDRATARRLSDSLVGRAVPGDFGSDVYWQASIASLLGERQRAMALLQEAYARGRYFSVSLHRDMDLEPLRDYPPFELFLRSRD